MGDDLRRKGNGRRAGGGEAQGAAQRRRQGDGGLGGVPAVDGGEAQSQADPEQQRDLRELIRRAGERVHSLPRQQGQSGTENAWGSPRRRPRLRRSAGRQQTASVPSAATYRRGRCRPSPRGFAGTSRAPAPKARVAAWGTGDGPGGSRPTARRGSDQGPIPSADARRPSKRAAPGLDPRPPASILADRLQCPGAHRQRAADVGRGSQQRERPHDRGGQQQRGRSRAAPAGEDGGGAAQPEAGENEG